MKELRKVSFPLREVDPVTGRWKVTGKLQGWFHCWGVQYEEFQGGGCEYTVAVVELPDGSIELPMAQEVVFLEPYKEEDK